MKFKNIYFLGIGGIGMSALARYFLGEGVRVGGYDLTETPLTRELTAEGATIHYTEDVEQIDPEFRDPATTLVVFTPAIPQGHKELVWFFDHGFHIEKRSEMLGHVSAGKFTMAVAGTHGKTTTSTLVAWLNRAVTGSGSAFLGGISKNFNSNLVLEPVQSSDALASERWSGKARDDLKPQHTNVYVRISNQSGNEASPPLSGQRLAVEADEFDRSFLRLNPDVAVITSVDADHLDIYGTYEAVREAFSEFVDKVKPGGAIILNSKVNINISNREITTYDYSLNDPTTDFRAENIRPIEGGYYEYDIVTPTETIRDCRLGITGLVNVENSIAAVALVWAAAEMRAEPLDKAKLREGLAGFRGVSRRFDFYVNTPEAVYMDDYAHHPAELSAALGSLRAMFPGRHITAIFQPHLYTRTRDLYAEFAKALSLADEVILLPIYPARELPIEGVGAEMIGRLITVPWRVVEKERLAETIAGMGTDVVVSFGAGNIADHCAEIAEIVKHKVSKRK
jgi:UDP-N-acetylmuramate--alanine ligase